MRLVESLERLAAHRELLQVEAEPLLAVGEFLGLEQLDGLLGGVDVFLVGVVHGQALEGRLRGEHHAVGEGVLGVDVVAEDDVRNLEGEHGVQVAHLLRAVGALDGGGVDQALGEQDRVADGERLERLGEQGAHADGARGRDLVVDEDVVGEVGERLVEGAGRVDQAGGVEALDDVVFGLLDPLALRAERADVVGGGVLGLVDCADDFEAGLVGFGGGNLQLVAPDVVDGLELEDVRGRLGVGFFGVEGGGQPQASVTLVRHESKW